MLHQAEEVEVEVEAEAEAYEQCLTARNSQSRRFATQQARATRTVKCNKKVRKGLLEVGAEQREAREVSIGSKYCCTLFLTVDTIAPK